MTSLSTRFASLELEHLTPALVDALEQMCLALNVDRSTIRRLADEKLRHALAEGERLRDQLENENDCLRREVTTLQGSSLVVGASKALRQALDQACQVAPTGATVLLLGETGTGKELFASQIHDLSPRRTRPMVRVNCSAIPSASSRASCSAVRRGPTPAPSRGRPAGSRSRRNRHSFLTRSATCRWRCRSSCCASCRSGRSSGSAAQSRSTWTFASWRRRTVIWRRPSRRARSARISITD